MGADSWLHLVRWELRFALRRSPFWLMLLTAALVPPVVALLHHYAEPTSAWFESTWLIGAQSLTQSALVSAWIVLSVKRQVAREVSDDWLLVIRYRQALLARYVAGAAIGLLLTVAAMLPSLALTAVLPHHAGSSLAAVLAGECWVLAGLLQPLAVSVLLVGAADFLLAPLSTVVSVLLFTALVWSALPGAGMYWLAVQHTNFALTHVYYDTPVLWMVVAFPVCLGLMVFGWRRSEDFWTLVRPQVKGETNDDSIGAIRGELSSAAAPKQSAVRGSASTLRAWLAALGCEPLVRFDVARYPAVGLRYLGALLEPGNTARRARERRLWAWGLGVLLAIRHFGLVRLTAETSYIWFALWWALAAGTVLRALASGAQIVGQERESGTLDSLVLAPLGLQRVLDTKLLVVLGQALPALVALAVLAKVGWMSTPTGLVATATLCAALGGLLAGTATGNKLVAPVLGAALTAAFYGLVRAACHPADWLLLHVGWPAFRDVAGCLYVLGLALALWAGLRPGAQRRLARSAALSRS